MPVQLLDGRQLLLKVTTSVLHTTALRRTGVHLPSDARFDPFPQTESLALLTQGSHIVKHRYISAADFMIDYACKRKYSLLRVMLCHAVTLHAFCCMLCQTGSGSSCCWRFHQSTQIAIWCCDTMHLPNTSIHISRAAVTQLDTIP